MSVPLMGAPPKGPDPSRDLLDDLRRWAAHHVPERGEVSGLHRMPGHSGLTFGFSLGDGDLKTAYVLRVPPLGVRHQHNMDVVRLAPVLRAVHLAGVPVPAVIDADADEQWFGTPYLIVERVAGAPLPDVFEASSGPYPEPEVVEDLFGRALQVLAQLHAIDPTGLLDAKWAEPVSVADDLAAWEPLLMKSDQPDEVRQTKELQSRLAATEPTDDRIAIVHGDFYSNNWLIDDGALTSVLDWENSTINRPMWDLGWIATIYDPACWGPSRGAMDWHPTGDELFSSYEAAGLGAVTDPDWYQAFMCYRLACITPAKVHLHRSGRRVDPIWEVFAEAVPYQLQRARNLLKGR